MSWSGPDSNCTKLRKLRLTALKSSSASLHECLGITTDYSSFSFLVPRLVQAFGKVETPAKQIFYSFIVTKR
jgi:hypothetical protein